MDQSDYIAGRIGLLMLWLIFLAAVPATIAAKKGRSFVPWYFYGYFLWLFAVVHSIMLPPLRTCRYCAEGIKKKAIVCPHCCRDLVEGGADPVGDLFGLKAS